jgi:hypothetical protein
MQSAICLLTFLKDEITIMISPCALYPVGPAGAS